MVSSKGGHDWREERKRNWVSEGMERKCTTVKNSAPENVSKKKTKNANISKKNAESLRDVFIRMIIIASQHVSFYLHNVMQYTVSDFKLSLAHSDGTLQ
jgi:hypothetical protein